MEEFNTLEKVEELFKKNNYNGTENNYFIAFNDLTKNSGFVRGSEYPYFAVLINETENGFGLIYLTYKALSFKLDFSKLQIMENKFEIINKEDIQSIKVKNYALLNSKKKKIEIKTTKKRIHYLYACVDQPEIPYHNEAFAKFLEKYSK
ncbi:MAG: hypothetical protein E7160_04170 [Firmicutes bacterium]|nr:hypothetical protein [Bacillota bacterium]